jgi:hypothetical protein
MNVAVIPRAHHLAACSPSVALSSPSIGSDRKRRANIQLPENCSKISSSPTFVLNSEEYTFFVSNVRKSQTNRRGRFSVLLTARLGLVLNFGVRILSNCVMCHKYLKRRYSFIVDKYAPLKE